MSTTRLTSDGFQIVRQKRKGKAKNKRIVSPFITGGRFVDSAINEETALRRIKAAREDLETSDYFKSFLITLNESLSVLTHSKVKEILCLGLGHIGECTISRYQLALVLCIRDRFKVECSLHDPIFYSGECKILRDLDFTLITENREGKHSLASDGITIVYLPHCPKQLTNNFLWKNWGTTLKNCVLICNSFMSLVESRSQRSLDGDAPYILNIYSFVQEFSLVNSFKYNDIFNDTSIHIFPEKALNHITENFWNKEAEDPSYEDGTEFITSDIEFKMAVSNMPTLRIIRRLLTEVRRNVPEKKLKDSIVAQYILSECRKYQTTDLQTCKAQEEVKYLAHTYLCYLNSKKNYEKINAEYSGKGERTVAETANLVGFKLPHDPK